jgi:hypothetical protein
MDKEKKISFPDWMVKELQDAYEQHGKNFIDMAADNNNMRSGDKLILIVSFFDNFKLSQLSVSKHMFIDCVIKADFLPEEKLLIIMLFNLADETMSAVATHEYLQDITAMGKGQLNSAMRGVIAKNLLTKDGDIHKLNISKFIKKLAEQHNIKV